VGLLKEIAREWYADGSGYFPESSVGRVQLGREVAVVTELIACLERAYLYLHLMR